MTPMDIPESVIAAGYVALGFSAENAKHYAEDPNSSIAHAIAGAITAWEDAMSRPEEEVAAELKHMQDSAYRAGRYGMREDIIAAIRALPLDLDTGPQDNAPVPTTPVRGVTVTRPDVRRGGDPDRPVRLTVADTAYVDLSNAQAAKVACELSPDLVGRGDGYSCVNGCAHCCPTHDCNVDC